MDPDRNAPSTQIPHALPEPPARVRRAAPRLWLGALLAMVLLASLFASCRLSGLKERLRPLPMPTATATVMPTATGTSTPPSTSTPAPTITNTPQPVLEPGANAVVSGTGADQLRVRQDPGLNTATLRTLPDGTVLRILEGPSVRDGYRWWKVREGDGQEGWVVGDWLKAVSP